MDVEQDDFRKKILIKSKWLDLYMAPAKLLLAAKVLEAFADSGSKANRQNRQRKWRNFGHNVCNFADNKVIQNDLVNFFPKQCSFSLSFQSLILWPAITWQKLQQKIRKTSFPSFTFAGFADLPAAKAGQFADCRWQRKLPAKRHV